jgi:hypothetical protein
MGLFDQWNNNKFNIYKSEEKTVLKLLESASNWIETLIKKADDLDIIDSQKVSYEELHNKYKLSDKADFTGSWFGLVKPTLSQEGVAAQVEKNMADILSLFSKTSDIIQYNLSSFCDDVSKTEEFITFIEGLDTTPKKLLIPYGKVLKLNKFFYLPSNTFITGEILFEGEVTVNDEYNESLIANIDGATNLVFDNLTVTYNLFNEGRSIFRFCNADGIVFNKCKFKIKGNGIINSNAIIDFWKGNRNVLIEKCYFEVDNFNSTAGGLIWVNNNNIVGVDERIITCKNFQIINNEFVSNSGDEMVSVFSNGNDVENVKVLRNTFTRKYGNNKNICLSVHHINNSIPGKISNVKIENNTFIIQAENPLSKEVVRFGSYLYTDVKIERSTFINNVIQGVLTNSQVVGCQGGTHEVIFAYNNIINTGEKGVSFGMKIDRGIGVIENNRITNCNTPLTSIDTMYKLHNFIDGVVQDFSNLKQKTYAKTGYRIHHDGLKEFWFEAYVDVNNGGTKAFTTPVTFTEIINLQATIVSNPTLTTPNPIAIVAGGYDKITLKNYNAEFISVQVRGLCI